MRTLECDTAGGASALVRGAPVQQLTTAVTEALAGRAPPVVAPGLKPRGERRLVM